MVPSQIADKKYLISRNLHSKVQSERIKLGLIKKDMTGRQVMISGKNPGRWACEKKEQVEKALETNIL